MASIQVFDGDGERAGIRRRKRILRIPVSATIELVCGKSFACRLRTPQAGMRTFVLPVEQDLLLHTAAYIAGYRGQAVRLVVHIPRRAKPLIYEGVVDGAKVCHRARNMVRTGCGWVEAVLNGEETYQ